VFLFDVLQDFNVLAILITSKSKALRLRYFTRSLHMCFYAKLRLVNWQVYVLYEILPFAFYMSVNLEHSGLLTCVAANLVI
jgi:hypothetical protein